MTGYLYIFGTILFTVYGQLVLKWRIVKYGALPEGLTPKIAFFATLLTDPYILSGFAAAFAASIFWMAAMTKFELSAAYPMIVGGLVLLTTLFAVVLLKEPVTAAKIAGIVLIIGGILLLGEGI